jgi:putative transposase
MSALPGLALQIGMVKACDGLALSRATHYRQRRPRVRGVATRLPPLKLSGPEQVTVVGELMSERFLDRAPHQVYATLLDEGRYLCSTRTMYRLLASQRCVRERRDQRIHPVYARPELIADAPLQVWSWDITKLKTTVKWTYFYLYVVIDIFSRYVVGWMLCTRETGALARDFVEQIVLREEISIDQLTLHSDRGSPMRSKTLAEKLIDLGIEPSFSRPQQSNDNPFSESFFKTVKYAPDFPECLESLDHGRAVFTPFFQHYNYVHRHTGIGLMTPAAVHNGHAAAITAARAVTLDKAFEIHPERFKGKRPSPPVVPDKVYINPPLKKDTDIPETH